MIDAITIRNDLKDIRYYFSRKNFFDMATTHVGENSILAKVKTYNDAVCLASPRLYDLYVSLYLQNNTQESLSDKLGYTSETICRLNGQLIKFFVSQLNKASV